MHLEVLSNLTEEEWRLRKGEGPDKDPTPSKGHRQVGSESRGGFYALLCQDEGLGLLVRSLAFCGSHLNIKSCPDALGKGDKVGGRIRTGK